MRGPDRGRGQEVSPKWSPIWIDAPAVVSSLTIRDYHRTEEVLPNDDIYIEPGATVEAGDTIAEVESTKSVAEVYAPMAGTIVAVNDALSEAPETVNTAAYDDGWFVVIEPADPSEVERLLDAAAYLALID